MSALSDFFWFWRKKRAPAAASVLVFGIGNPGPKYQGTRHNAGFMVIDRLESMLTDKKKEQRPSFAAVTGVLSGKRAVLVRPKTFVNLSGDAFVSSSALFGVPAGSSLVVVDDYRLPLGTIRLRRGGSDGGHNGLASIIEKSGPDFPRIRIGIGPLPAGTGAVDFVLGKFSDQELPALESGIRSAFEAIVSFCECGIEKAMNQYNRSDTKKTEQHQ